MIGKLDDPDLARAAQPAHPESAGLEQSVVVRVDTVVAVIVLGRLGNAVQRGGAAIGEHEDRLRLPDERARERRDNEPPGTGRRLGVVGVSEPENVARELDDRVLEAASGTDEGNSPFRSEEHTSELQSQSNLVCRLLLEKKNKRDGKHAWINRRHDFDLSS